MEERRTDGKESEHWLERKHIERKSGLLDLALSP